MNAKMKIKIIIDALMTVLLLLLMAFQITGQEFHEWLGAGMLILFLAHNILNFKWYRYLLKGRYSIIRVLQVLINFAVLFSMLCLAYSGIVMSHYVFDFVSVKGQMALARQMHMAASYWGFVLMSVHLGFHWGMVVGILGKIVRKRKIPNIIPWILRIIAVGVAGYGAVCFYKADIVSYLFLKNQFAFFDFEQTVVSVFTEYIAIMGLWVFIGYYSTKGMNRICIFMFLVMMVLMTSACGKDSNSLNSGNETGSSSEAAGKQLADKEEAVEIPEGFVKIQGGTFQMGSPEAEAWRSNDEKKGKLEREREERKRILEDRDTIGKNEIKNTIQKLRLEKEQLKWSMVFHCVYSANS